MFMSMVNTMSKGVQRSCALLSTVFALSFVATVLYLPPLTVEAADYKEGVHYFKLSNKQRVPSLDDNKVEIIEAFWYGCGHCQRYEPLLRKWAKENSDKVTLNLFPVIWNDLTRDHAKLFYVAQALNIVDLMHPILFDSILLKGNLLRTENQALSIFVKNGVTRAAFQKAWSSFLIKHALARSVKNIKKYEVSGTPTLIINREYRTGPNSNTNYQQTLEVADMLVDRVLAHKAIIKDTASKNKATKQAP